MKMIDGLCSRARANRFFTSLEAGNNSGTVFFCPPPLHIQFVVTVILKTRTSLFAFPQPLGHQVRGGDGEEGGVVGFCRYRLGQVGLPCSRRAKQEDSPPWSPLAYKNTCSMELETGHTFAALFSVYFFVPIPVNRWGNLIGRMTASFKASLAPSSPATSFHFTFGFSITMAPGKGDDFSHYTQLKHFSEFNQTVISFTWELIFEFLFLLIFPFIAFTPKIWQKSGNNEIQFQLTKLLI